MKMAKAIRQQAATAERVAVNTADTYVANQMRTLAKAFRLQADITKKIRRRNELLEKRNVQARRTCPTQEDRRSCAQEDARNVANRLLRHLHYHA